MRCTACSLTLPMPAPTPSAAPAPSAASTPTGGCGFVSPRAAADPVGGAPSPASSRVHRLEHLPGDQAHPHQHPPDRAPARHRRGARGLRAARAWPPAGCAGANSPSTTTARPRPPPATTAPAPARCSTARAPGTCASAAPGIDAGVAEAFLAALQPAALQACLTAAQQLEDGHDAALAQWRRQVEHRSTCLTQKSCTVA